MKIHTGTGQVFIIFWCNCNAGVQVQNSHLCKKTLQGSIESASCTAAPPVMSHINRHLRTPAISSPRVKRRTIGISQDLSLLFCHNIRIFHLYIMDSLRKLFYGRCFVFKCDRSFFYVVGINFQKCCCILLFCHTYLHCLLAPLLFLFVCYFTKKR